MVRGNVCKSKGQSSLFLKTTHGQTVPTFVDDVRRVDFAIAAESQVKRTTAIRGTRPKEAVAARAVERAITVFQIAGCVECGCACESYRTARPHREREAASVTKSECDRLVQRIHCYRIEKRVSPWPASPVAFPSCIQLIPLS